MYMLLHISVCANKPWAGIMKSSPRLQCSSHLRSQSTAKVPQIGLFSRTRFSFSQVMQLQRFLGTRGPCQAFPCPSREGG